MLLLLLLLLLMMMMMMMMMMMLMMMSFHSRVADDVVGVDVITVVDFDVSAIAVRPALMPNSKIFKFQFNPPW
jgi:hypothetical protein